MSEHQDTIGPLTRTVRDGAILLQAIAGYDPRDNYTSAIPGGTVPDFVAACQLSALSGKRLGVPRNVLSLLVSNATQQIITSFNQSLHDLEAAGATIVENTNFPAVEELEQYTLPTIILNADFVVNIRTYLSYLSYNPNNITTLERHRPLGPGAEKLE